MKAARNFQTDLKRGQAGELAFLKLFSKLVGTDGRKGDILAPDGSKIELKTDFYPQAKTANYFIERYSSMEVLSPGGPWQAQAHNCKYFIYYYTVDKVGYIFSTSDIVTQVEKLEPKLTPVEIRNAKWTTLGYKVPRSLLQHSVRFTTDTLEVCNDFVSITDWGFSPTIER